MPQPHTPQDRDNLLADVAEMYYLEEKGQAEIARTVGVTRSMISRMLKEARQKGIVEARVHRTLRSEHDLEAALIERFGLQGTYVVAIQQSSSELILSYLGHAGAQILKRYLAAGATVGLSWGTSVSAAVDAVGTDRPLDLKVVQLVGALGARNAQYDGHALVLRLAEKTGGEGYFLNAPFLCPNRETAEALRETPSIKETLRLGTQAQLAVVGIGSAWPSYSSYFLAGYVKLQDLDELQKAGAVGDVCGLHFDIKGRDVCGDFCDRSITISKQDLLNIPIRVGIAGGAGKAEPILGALRGGYVNVLVTDGITARNVLELAEDR
jgi:deoxyribonucleoside regulator